MTFGVPPSGGLSYLTNPAKERCLASVHGAAQTQFEPRSETENNTLFDVICFRASIHLNKGITPDYDETL